MDESYKDNTNWNLPDACDYTQSKEAKLIYVL